MAVRRSGSGDASRKAVGALAFIQETSLLDLIGKD